MLYSSGIVTYIVRGSGVFCGSAFIFFYFWLVLGVIIHPFFFCVLLKDFSLSLFFVCLCVSTDAVFHFLYFYNVWA